MPNFDWDDNEAPLAFLITFRTFGTWLHGDARCSVDRHGKNLYGAAGIAPNEKLESIMSENMSVDEFRLDGRQRTIVEAAIRSVCKVRNFGLSAINVRTNHVHSVVSASRKPELIANAFKSNATRELRNAGLVVSQRVWSRGSTTRYLWKPSHVDGALEYVLYGQGDDLSKF